MRLEQLEYFVALKKYGSMPIASEKLYVTQQTLSIAIKKLEQELGGALLIRTSKGVDLTELGEQVYDKVVKILFLKEDIIQLGLATKNAQTTHSLTGSIKIAATAATLQNILTTSIKWSYKRNPRLNIICENFPQIQILTQMNLGNYDMGFMNISQAYLDQHQHEFFADDYQIEILTSDKLMLLVGAHSDLARQKTVSIKRAVQNYTLACGSKDSLAFLDINPVIEANKIVPSILQCPNLNVICDNVVNNNSVAFLSCGDSNLMHCVYKDEMVMIPLRENIPVVTIAIIPKNRPLSEEASAFLEIVKEFVQTAD